MNQRNIKRRELLSVGQPHRGVAQATWHRRPELSQQSHLPLQLSGFPQIIGILKGENLSAGHGGAPVASRGCPGIILRYDSQSISIATENRLSLVGGTVVHHDEFKVRIALAKDVVNGLGD